MNEIHEPQTIKDSKNAAAYFLIMTAMTCGLAFFIAAMFAPCFIPWMFRNLDKHYEECPDDKVNSKRDRTIAVILSIIVCILSWTFFIILNNNSTH